MTSRPRKQAQTHKALREFVGWVAGGMEDSIHNCLELKRAIPAGLTNPVLRFVVPQTREHVAQRLVLDVVEAWDLLSSELKRQGSRQLGTGNKDYRHLKRVRNKLVAHHAENLVKTSRHKGWYGKHYDYERLLSLVRRVAQRISGKVDQLMTQKRISRRPVTTTKVPRFSSRDIEELLDAIKARGIY